MGYAALDHVYFNNTLSLRYAIVHYSNNHGLISSILHPVQSTFDDPQTEHAVNITELKPVCSDAIQTAATFKSTTSKSRDVRPNTTRTKTTASASPRASTKTPNSKLPVRSVPDRDQHFTMADSTGRNVSYMTPTAGLVMTDPSAAAPMTLQLAPAGAAMPLNTHVSAYYLTSPSQCNDGALD